MPIEGCIENAFLWLCYRVQHKNLLFRDNNIHSRFLYEGTSESKDQLHHYTVVNAELSEGKQAKRMKIVTMEKTL